MEPVLLFGLGLVKASWLMAICGGLGWWLLPLALGAVSTTNVRRTADEYVFTVTATADADTVTASIPHGMGVIPEVTLTQLIIQTVVSAALWTLTTLDATNLVLTKAVGVGSGNASPQLRVCVRRPR